MRPRIRRLRSTLALSALLAGCAAGAAGGADPDPVPAADSAAAGTVRLLNAREAARGMDIYYDDLLRDAGVTGTVEVDLTLNADGTVRAERVVRSTHDRFRASARRVAPRLLFTPPAADGAVVRVRMKFVHRRGEIDIVGP